LLLERRELGEGRVGIDGSITLARILRARIVAQRRPALAVALVAALVAITAAVAFIAAIALTVAEFLALVVAIAVAALALAFETLAAVATLLAGGRAVGGSSRSCCLGGRGRSVLLGLAEIAAAAVVAMTLALLTLPFALPLAFLGGLPIGSYGAVLTLSLNLTLALALPLMALATAALMPRPALVRAAAGAPDLDHDGLGRRSVSACGLDSAFGGGYRLHGWR
jgi:hypothetical protein